MRKIGHTVKKRGYWVAEKKVGDEVMIIGGSNKSTLVNRLLVRGFKVRDAVFDENGELEAMRK